VDTGFRQKDHAPAKKSDSSESAAARLSRTLPRDTVADSLKL
jgi:hypothetical protein